MKFSKIKKISGILNGTTNYILTTMESENKSFEEVLTDAKQKGFTSDHESKLDIGGYDAAHKLTLLTSLAYGSHVDFGLNEIDKKIHRYLDYNSGYFVELGANDGISQSNTLFLERSKRWKGTSSIFRRQHKWN